MTGSFSGLAKLFRASQTAARVDVSGKLCYVTLSRKNTRKHRKSFVNAPERKQQHTTSSFWLLSNRVRILLGVRGMTLVCLPRDDDCFPLLSYSGGQAYVSCVDSKKMHVEPVTLIRLIITLTLHLMANSTHTEGSKCGLLYLLFPSNVVSD